MASDAVLISVVIPAFNAAATLAKTVASAAAQTHRCIEILIVDDGSRDATAAIAEQLAAGDPRIRLLRQPNRGVSAARNRGIGEARGDFIAPLDADDLWHPDKLALQLAVALGPDQPGFVYCYARRIDPDGRVVGLTEAVAATGAAFHRHLYCNRAAAGGSAPLIRRDALLSVGGYEESLQGCEDYVMHVRLSAVAAVGVVPLFLCGYRGTPGSISSDPNAMFACWLKARKLLRARYGGRARTVLRWGHGRRCLNHAEALAIRRRWGAAALQLGRAMWFDPIRSSVYLAHRVLRKIALGIGGRPVKLLGPAFGDIAPEQDVDRSAVTLYDRFRQRRLDRLAAFDRAAGRLPDEIAKVDPLLD